MKHRVYNYLIIQILRSRKKIIRLFFMSMFQKHFYENRTLKINSINLFKIEKTDKLSIINLFYI